MPDCFLPAGSDSGSVPITAVTADSLAEVAASLPPPAAQWISAAGFEAGRGEVCLLPGRDGALEQVLFGLGQEGDEPSLAAGVLPAALPAGRYRLGDGFGDPRLAAIAWALGGYRFDRYRTRDTEPRRLVMPDTINPDEVSAVADGIFLARDLVNTPANDLGPAELAEASGQLAAHHGAVSTDVVEPDKLAEGFPLIDAVGAAAAADRAPRLIDFAWGDSRAPRLTLVGKGVCFDTGGLDIKPAAGMIMMKKDMGGAAAVLGLASMIMAAGLRVRLRVLIPAVENAISAGAFRPGDIFTSRQGLTVEIGNTDAEGRLVLADALTYACEESPDLLIDLATLTGAARVALGPDIAPIYTDDDDLAAAATHHGAKLADPLWRMPLWRGYMTMLDSKAADINNVGKGGFAGSVTAALFLSRFVTPETIWMHGDIYGWNPSSRPGRPEGGEAPAIRALFALLSERYPT